MKYDCTLPHRRFFYEIAQLPHGSKNEKPLSDYLVAFARAHHLAYQQDDLYNVIIRKPATPGYENAPVLGLQAHMDMVCEKSKDKVHDFCRDPLTFVVDEAGILRADGTTLGADDCTGVAYMLSVLEDDSLPHPELECIFTTQEEIGMFGAMALKPEDIRCHRMISLDGGGENNTLLTSAGGCRLEMTRKLEMEVNSAPCYAVRVMGLSGGHSGGEIHKEKGNADKLLIRILKEARLAGLSIQLGMLNGGLKDNAIPRECEAIIASREDPEILKKQIEKSAEAIWKELEFSDSGFQAEVESVSPLDQVWTNSCSDSVIDMLFLYPNGFVARSMAVEGLTMTSLNLGILSTEGDELRIVVSVRSMLSSAIDDLVNRIDTVNKLFGAVMERGAEYPGWNYSENSPMRETMRRVVKRRYHEELNVTAAHGGCECGVFSAIHGDMDIISIGPVTEHIHTPDEQLDLASFDRTYHLLTDVIKDCR